MIEEIISEMVKIVTAKEQHIPRLAELNLLVQQLHADKYPEIFKYPVQTSVLKDEFTSLINKPDYFIFVALDGIEVVGYVLVQYFKRPDSLLIYGGDKLYIHHVSVAENSRNIGIGSKLFERVEKLAQESGVKDVALDVWSFNNKAKSFFKAYGFQTYNEKMLLRK